MQICCRFHCFCSPCVHSCQHCVAWILSCLLCVVWGLQFLVISLFDFASFWCVLSGKHRVWWPQFAFQRGCCCIWWPGSCPLGLVWCGDYGFCQFPCLISIFLLVVLLAWCGVGNLVLLGWLGVGNTSVGLISSPVFVILPGSRCKEKTANSKVECPLVLQVGAIVLQPSCLS